MLVETGKSLHPVLFRLVVLASHVVRDAFVALLLLVAPNLAVGLVCPQHSLVMRLLVQEVPWQLSFVEMVMLLVL